MHAHHARTSCIYIKRDLRARVYKTYGLFEHFTRSFLNKTTEIRTGDIFSLIIILRKCDLISYERKSELKKNILINDDREKHKRSILFERFVYTLYTPMFADKKPV